MSPVVHDAGVRDPGDDIPGRVGPAEMEKLHAPLPEIDRHLARERHARPGQAGDRLGRFEQAWKAAIFAFPVFLAALMDHGAARFRRDDLIGMKS